MTITTRLKKLKEPAKPEPQPEPQFKNKKTILDTEVKTVPIAFVMLFVFMIVLVVGQGKDHNLYKEQTKSLVAKPTTSNAIYDYAHLIYGYAEPYIIVDTGDYSFPGRNRKGINIYSPEATTQKARAATAMQAAYDYQEETKADVVTATMVYHPNLANTGELLANVAFYTDGCGLSGDRCDGVLWTASAVNKKYNHDDVLFAIYWYKHREEYRNRNGLVDQPALNKFLIEKYDLKKDINDYFLNLPWPEKIELK